MTDALCRELIFQKDYLGRPLETIYLGGGTPSILTARQLYDIFNTIFSHYTLASQTEITLEANPDDITPAKLDLWKAVGINRLSIGVQSFFDKDLLWMNRSHNAVQAKNALKIAQDKGITNISIDLIYGTPTLTEGNWRENLKIANDLQLPHLSCYALTVEEKTALHTFIQKGKTLPIEEDQQASHFEILMSEVATFGYEQYEISNFAKPGFRSRHNSNYWSGQNYLGIGPSAHSYNGESRQWNVNNNILYIKALCEGRLPFEREILSNENKLDEYVMTSLRTIEGINTNFLEQEFGILYKQHVLKSATKWSDEKMLYVEDSHIKLTQKGKLLADGIAADLFL